MSTKNFVNNLCINIYRKLRSKNIISGKKKFNEIRERKGMPLAGNPLEPTHVLLPGSAPGFTKPSVTGPVPVWSGMKPVQIQNLNLN